MVTLLDGATGTRLWALAEEKGVDRVSTWRYNLEHPELVIQVAAEYIAAGSRLICANSFAASVPNVAHECPDLPAEAVTAAAIHAAKTAAAGTEAKVALDIGPLPILLEPFGDLSAAEAEALFARQIAGGMAEKPDCIYLETFQSLEMLCAALRAAKAYDLPVLCSMSFEKSGRTLMGDRVETIAETLSDLGAAAVGLNCSFGPAAAIPVIEEFAKVTDLPLILKPNADGSGGPAQFAAELAPVLDKISYLGACCGSDPDYIRAIAKLL